MLAATAGVLLILTPGLLANDVLNAPHLRDLLVIGVVFVIFSSLNGLQVGAFAGLEAFGQLGIAGVISGIAAVSAIGLGAYFGGLAGAVWGLVVSSTVRWLAHQFLLRRELKRADIRATFKGSLYQERAMLTTFAFPAALAVLSTVASIWIANVFLVNTAEGYKQLAIYSAATTIRLVVLFVPQTLNTVTFSVLNNTLGSQNIKHFQLILTYSIIAIVTVTAALAAAMLLLTPLVLSFFGADFVKGASVAYILLASTIFEAAALALVQKQQSTGRIWAVLLLITLPRDCDLPVGFVLAGGQSWGDGVGLRLPDRIHVCLPWLHFDDVPQGRGNRPVPGQQPVAFYLLRLVWRPTYACPRCQIVTGTDRWARISAARCRRRYSISCRHSLVSCLGFGCDICCGRDYHGLGVLAKTRRHHRIAHVFFLLIAVCASAALPLV